MYSVSWNDFDNYGYDVTIGDQRLVGLPNNDPMEDGDLIYFTPSDGPSPGVQGDQVQLVLETTADVTWHKYLIATDGGAITYGRIDLENNNHGPYSVTVPVLGTFLVLGKAKFLGTWTAIYQTPLLEPYAGMRLIFLWSKD